MSANRNMYAISVSTHLSPTPLHNLMNSQKVDKERAHRLLNLLENYRKGWCQHRLSVFVEKSQKLSSRLKTARLPSFASKPIVEKKEIALQSKTEISPKDISAAEKHMSLAKERGMSLNDILSYDLLPTCPLFEGDFPATAKKSQLLTEISPSSRVFKSKWVKSSTEPSAVHVDFMSRARRQPLEAFATVGELIDVVLKSSISFCNCEYIHLLLDSYIEFSLKEPERLRRSNGLEGIDVVNLSESSPTPKQKELFWASESNKTNLQKLLREMVPKRQCQPFIYISSMIEDGELLPAISTKEDQGYIPELTEWVEEADEQIILHVNHSIKHHKIKRHIVLSNDTDSFVLLLRYTPFFINCGATEIWIQFGIGEHERMIPLHEVSASMGPSKSLTMIKADILTGGDALNKVGKKHAAVQINPEQ